MRALVEELELSAGQVFGILRVAVTGQTVSPPLFESMEIVGKEKVIERVKKAIAILDRARDRSHVFNLGHGVLPQTDAEVITRLTALVHERTASVRV